MTAIRIEAAKKAIPNSIFSRHRQRGIATILIMLLVGLSLTAAVLGAIYYTRAAQDQLLTVHAQTQAQMRAWTGAETVRKFLEQLQTNSQLPTLAAQLPLLYAQPGAASSVPITIAGLSGVSAQFTAVDNATNPTQFYALISGTAVQGTKGASNSTLQVVYAVSGVSPAPSLPGGITFKKGIKLSGGINVETDPNSNDFTINVIGDVVTEGNSITGVHAINSTGSISLGSGSGFDVLNANCDVRLTGSVSAATVNARRHICLLGGAAGTKAINANGSVHAESGYDLNGAIAAVGNPQDVGSCRATGLPEDTSNAQAQTCDTPSSTYVVDLSSGSAGAKSVDSKGSVILGAGHIGVLHAEGDLNVNWGAKVDGGAITGTVKTPSQYFDKSTVKVTENMTGLTVSIPLVSRVTLNSTIIDANDYKSIANYVFNIDAQGYKKVTVRNVSGISDGVYYLGNYAAGGQMDYLCQNLAAGSTSASPICSGTYSASSPPTICKGYSTWNTCFSYNSGTSTWSIDGNSMAQGIAWFEGNLNVGSGVYYNTFIATGNITTSGSDKIYALNYAGYAGTNNNVRYAPTGICSNSNFPTIYPKQFCDASSKTYLKDADNGIGNYVTIAGSVKGGKYTGANSYVGGNVTVGASTELFGSAMSGNEFISGGSTTIHGYVTALALGTSTTNSMGGSTTFKLKLSELPPTFSPGTTLDGGGNGGGGAGIKIQWSRYL